MDHIRSLLHNDWIEECGGAWGSLIVLAAKPHQEHIDDIADFIWRMCVSYRKLNSVTLAFAYPIPRCDDAIDDFGDGVGRLFISLDAHQGYHQILVRLSDREKLAFFAPDQKKYTFKVMPFGPTNAPAVYTAMMRQLQDEWDSLFEELHPNSAHRGCRVIIDDILLYSSDVTTLIQYLDCVCQVFIKYQVSLKLGKCDFLKERFEYVGHDITADGNCPAESKFDLVRDWVLPSTGQGLRSFVSLCNFYHRFCPWFEVSIKPFRGLMSEFHRLPIPPDRWNPDLVSLFDKLKRDIVSSPLLARFDSGKPSFLKTDWSAAAFGFILMQPDDSAESVAAMDHLLFTGECMFDLTLKGARLRPVRFGSRRCTPQEQHYHSFVGEAAVGRWAINQNRKYLWGTTFYWLCDCSGVKEILEYDGPIHQVRRWAQELLGYSFHIVHRPARMMADVDAFTRRHGPLITSYLRSAVAMDADCRAERPARYDPAVFGDNPMKCPDRIPPVSAAASDTVTDAVTVTASVPDTVANSATDTVTAADLTPVTAPDTAAGSELVPFDVPILLALPHAAADLVPVPVAGAAPVSEPVPLDVPTVLAVPSRGSDRPPVSASHPLFPSVLLSSSPVCLRHLADVSTPGCLPVSAPSQFAYSPAFSSNSTLAQVTPSIVHWLSITPGFPSFGFHLCTSHRSLFACDLVILVSTPFVASLCSALLPTCRTVAMSLSDALRHSTSAPTAVGEAPVGGLTPVDAAVFCASRPLDGADATCPYLCRQNQIQWLRSLLAMIAQFPSQFGLFSLVVVIPATDAAVGCAALDELMDACLPSWACTCTVTNSACHGDGVSALRWVGVATRARPFLPSVPAVLPTDVSVGFAVPFGDSIRSEFCSQASALGRLPVPHSDPPPSNSDTFRPRPLLLPSGSAFSSAGQSYTVYDPDFPSPEPSCDPAAPSFALPFSDSLGRNLFRWATATELLSLYSCPSAVSTFLGSLPLPLVDLSSLLCSCLPFVTASVLVDSIVDVLFHSLDRCDTDRADTVSVLLQHATRPAAPLDWAAAYASDPDTHLIFQSVLEGTKWDQGLLNRVSSTYRPFLRDSRMSVTDGKLVALQPVSNRSQVIALIVVPLSLRRHVFSAYHASPVAGHMKEFKTLHRLRLRFLWPKMRSDISSWVRMCPHCILTDKQTRENKELVFSWPVTSPFFILHVDLWAPGSLTDYRGNTYLLAGMCDLTGFVVQTAVSNITSHDLARIFYQEFLLKFGMCGMVVVDAGSNFLAVFEAMCAVLQIRCHAAAKGNHKAVSVERYFRFLNKAVTIAINDRDDHTVWVAAAMTAGYAWNSAPIDGTDILRSVAAVG
jgi:hypothetical protein